MMKRPYNIKRNENKTKTKMQKKKNQKYKKYLKHN